MADVYAGNWTEDDNSNSTPSPDGLPEGCAPSGVNNWARATMGAIKRFANQQIPATTAGSSTAYTLTYGTAPGALVDGMTHLVQFNAANGAAPTLNVNSLGALPLQYYSAGAWRAVPASLWDADEIFSIAYNSSAGAYRLINFRNRTGTVEPFAGTTAPAGSLLCYGQAISRTDYVGLFTALSTTYGVGDGSLTFNLPDLRGRVAAGKDNMGGSAASRLTGSTMSPDGNTLGATGGAQTHTHWVSGSTGGPTTVAGVEANAPTINVADHLHSHTITGTAAASSSLPPTLLLNYVIRI